MQKKAYINIERFADVKANNIYIKAKSAEHFKNLITPYMHETMMYKL